MEELKKAVENFISLSLDKLAKEKSKKSGRASRKVSMEVKEITEKEIDKKLNCNNEQGETNLEIEEIKEKLEVKEENIEVKKNIKVIEEEKVLDSKEDEKETQNDKKSTEPKEETKKSKTTDKNTIEEVKKDKELSATQTALQRIHMALDNELSKKETISDKLEGFENEIEVKLQYKGISVISKDYEEIATKVFPDNDMRTNDINIKVSEAKIAEGGFFSSATVYYSIETTPYGWKVWRQYRDCLNLRKELKKFFPCLYIPPLSKKYSKDKTDKKWIYIVSSQIQAFFDEILKYPILRASEMTFYFLSLSNREQYNRKIKSYGNGPLWKDVTGLMNFNGRAKIELNQEIVDKSNYWSKFSILGKNLYDIAMKAMIETNKIMTALGTRLEQNAVLFKTFAMSYEKLGGIEIAHIFKELTKMSSYLGKIEKLQADMYKKKYAQFFEHFQDEFVGISEITELLDISKEKFQLKQDELYTVKDKLFKEGNAGTWGIPPETLLRRTDICSNKTLAFPLMLPEVVNR